MLITSSSRFFCCTLPLCWAIHLSFHFLFLCASAFHPHNPLPLPNRLFYKSPHCPTFTRLFALLSFSSTNTHVTASDAIAGVFSRLLQSTESSILGFRPSRRLSSTDHVSTGYSLWSSLNQHGLFRESTASSDEGCSSGHRRGAPGPPSALQVPPL